MLISSRNRVVAGISRVVLVVAGVLLISLGLSPSIRADNLSEPPFGGAGVGCPTSFR